MNWLVKFKMGLIFCLALSSSGLLAAPVVWQIIDSRLAGERDQIEGVTHPLVQRIQREKGVSPEVRVLDLKEEKGGEGFDFSGLRVIPENNPQDIFISSGVYGIQAFQVLKKKNTSGIFIYVSHQIIGDDAKTSPHTHDLKGIADFIVLPHHVFEVSDPRADSLKAALAGSTTRLLEITGVVHNMRPEDLSKDFAEHGGEIPPAKKYVLVILGGDVQNKDGETWTFYSPQEAQKLADFIDVQMKQDPDLFVLVTNGPRTGRFDPETKKDANFHQKGGPLDPVTAAFMEGLFDQNRVRLYNFEKGTLSLFKALLGAVSAKEGSTVFVPGDSTSMISQVIDMMPKESVVLYNHSAMQDIHQAHVKDEVLKGRASVLDKPEDTLTKHQPQEKIEAASSGSAVADKVWEF